MRWGASEETILTQLSREAETCLKAGLAINTYWRRQGVLSSAGSMSAYRHLHIAWRKLLSLGHKPCLLQGGGPSWPCRGQHHCLLVHQLGRQCCRLGCVCKYTAVSWHISFHPNSLYPTTSLLFTLQQAGFLYNTQMPTMSKTFSVCIAI